MELESSFSFNKSQDLAPNLICKVKGKGDISASLSSSFTLEKSTLEPIIQRAWMGSKSHCKHYDEQIHPFLQVIEPQP
jgi:hypothetical protein